MRITLARPYDGHDPDTTVDLPVDVARRLVREGKARLPVEPADGEAPVVKPTAADVDAYAQEHGTTKVEARRRLAALSVAPTTSTTNLPTAPAAATK